MDAETFLAHHGVKGMKWGIINEDRPASNGSSVKDVLSSNDKKVLAKAGMSNANSELLRQKYDPTYNPPKNKEKFQLTSGQKKALIAGGVGVAVVGSAFAAYYLSKKIGFAHENAMINLGLKEHPGLIGTSEGFQSLWKNLESDKSAAVMAFDPKTLSTTPLSFPAGSIFSRVSTVAETKINRGGFYAAFDQEDVNRYKAILPVYWKRWAKTTKATEGFVINYANTKEIKAPSMKESYDIWQSMVQKNPKVVPLVMRMMDKMTGETTSSEKLAQQSFIMMTQRWVKPNATSKAFFKEAKKRGYNALIDVNDAGSLAKTPLRFIDGSIFKITGHEALTQSAIKTAQDQIVALSPVGGG